MKTFCEICGYDAERDDTYREFVQHDCDEVLKWGRGSDVSPCCGRPTRDCGCDPNEYGANAVKPWPDPTLEMLETPEFNAVWECIKRWDINVPDVYAGYCGANGNHVRAILDALEKAK